MRSSTMPPCSRQEQVYMACPSPSLLTSLVTMRCTASAARGPFTDTSPMWDTSKMPTASRTVLCSSRMPVLYCTGMSDEGRLSQLERLVRLEPPTGDAPSEMPLPSRGVAVQWAARRGGAETVERIYRLDDGSSWRSTLLVEENAFFLEATSAGTG